MQSVTASVWVGSGFAKTLNRKTAPRIRRIHEDCSMIAIVLVAWLSTCLLSSCAAQDAQGDAPNILLIFADDAGYNDFSFMGSEEFRTPHIDRLANQGVVCTSGYMSGSVCVPSRAGLLTGRYQQRFGNYLNDFKLNLPQDELNVGEALKTLGYRTGVIGKWQIGKSEGYRPNDRGFDYFFGFLAGHRSYFPYTGATKKGRDPDFLLMENRQQLDERGMSFYTTDLFTDKAIDFMESGRESAAPFLLYLSHNAVHGPLHATDADRAPYAGLTDPKRRTLGGMISALDRSTGRLIDYLEASGQRENTLVVFTNDNGGSPATHADNSPLRGHKGTIYEGGNRVPFVVSWPGRLPEGIVFDHPVVSLDLYATFLTLAGGDPQDHPKPLDGVDLMPHLLGDTDQPPHDALFWQARDAAVRADDWKLIHWMSRDGEFELYNLAEDVAEQKNVLDENPEVAERLKKLLIQWQVGNAPLPRKLRKAG